MVVKQTQKMHTGQRLQKLQAYAVSQISREDAGCAVCP